MPAFYIAEHIITDSETFEEYRVKVGPMIVRYGGRYLTKGGSHKFPEEAHWKPERVVIIEFTPVRTADHRPVLDLKVGDDELVDRPPRALLRRHSSPARS